MGKKRHQKRKAYKKPKAGNDSLFECDETFAFIAGYTSNGVPYGLTHEELEEMDKETDGKRPDNNNKDLPF